MGLQNKRIYKISSKSNNGKVVKYTGKIYWGGILGKKSKSTKWGCKISVYAKFHPNRTMGKQSNIRGKFSGGEFRMGGEIQVGNFGKKMKIYKMGLQNKRIYEISSKSNNEKVVKYTGKIFWGEISQGEGEFRGGILGKKSKSTKWGCKISM